MGEKQRKPFQLTFNGLLDGRLPWIARHFRRWLNPSSGVDDLTPQTGPSSNLELDLE